MILQVNLMRGIGNKIVDLHDQHWTAITPTVGSTYSFSLPFIHLTGAAYLISSPGRHYEFINKVFLPQPRRWLKFLKFSFISSYWLRFVKVAKKIIKGDASLCLLSNSAITESLQFLCNKRGKGEIKPEWWKMEGDSEQWMKGLFFPLFRN